MRTEPLTSPGIEKRRLIVADVTVVDPRDGSLSPQQAVWIESGQIRRVTSAEMLKSEPTATVVNASGKYVVPGFLDMHTHCMQDSDPGHGLSLMLTYGITGTRQMAGTPALLTQRREGKLNFGPDTPELLAMPGDILTSANASTPDASVAEVRRQKEQGADFIKTIFVTPKVFAASLAAASRLGLPYGGHISPGVDMVKSSKAGLRFVEHLGPIDSLLLNTSRFKPLLMLLLRLRPPAAMKLSMEGMGDETRIAIANPMLLRLKLDANAMSRTQRLMDSFSEGKCKKLAEAFARNGTWMCPTLIRNKTMQFADSPEFTDSPDLQYVSKENRALWSDATQQYRERLTPAFRETIQRQNDLSLRITRMFDEAGVKMTAGTDAGGGGGWLVPGVSLHQEFDLLGSAGLSPLKVLQIATCNGAEFLNRLETLGSVSEGKRADMVVLDANPLERVQNLHTLAGVVREGRYYSLERMLDLRKRVASQIAAA